MTEGMWLSSLIGAGIAGLYSLTALWLGKVALRSPQRMFLMIVFGGMVARLFLTVIVLTLILLFSPLDNVGLLIGFAIVFIIGLTAEVLFLHRIPTSMVKESEPEKKVSSNFSSP